LALREFGYIEGQNIATEYRYAEGKRNRFPELAAELVRLKVDVLVVAGGNTPVRAAKNATQTIPIVMAGGSDPVEAGLVESLARPGANVTGLTNLARELGGKRLELLKEAVPKLARVAVLYDAVNPSHVREVKEILPMTADALKLTIRPWEAPDPDDFKEFAEAGGLMSYGADIDDVYRRAAIYVDKIIKGSRPGELPVEQPTDFQFVINLKAAKQIGVTIPPYVLARADRVIK
jgi:putative tryptophan/tyrosine transport system substrate-binding protein